MKNKGGTKFYQNFYLVLMGFFCRFDVKTANELKKTALMLGYQLRIHLTFIGLDFLQCTEWRKRRRSGAKSAELNVRDRLGSKVHLSPDKKERKSCKKELDTSVESIEDILARMKKKNKKRMKRLQEIERDKLLHS